MAQFIIFDGQSRTGKSTCAKMLSQLLGVGLVEMPNKVPKDISDKSAYYSGAAYSGYSFMQAMDTDDLYVLDRSIFTNLIFSQVFNRPLQFDDSLYDKLLKKHEYLFINFHSSYTHYTNWVNIEKDGYIYTTAQHSKIRAMFSYYNKIFLGYGHSLIDLEAGDPNITIQNIINYEHAGRFNRHLQKAKRVYGEIAHSD